MGIKDEISQRVSPSDLPFALVVHEITGLSISIAALALCYKARPMHLLATRTQLGQQCVHKLHSTFPGLKARSEKAIARFRSSALIQVEPRFQFHIHSLSQDFILFIVSIANGRRQLLICLLRCVMNYLLQSAARRWGISTDRLLMAAGESILLRRCLAPITIPGKLWVAWKAVEWKKGKREQKDQKGGVSIVD